MIDDTRRAHRRRPGAAHRPHRGAVPPEQGQAARSCCRGPDAPVRSPAHAESRHAAQPRTPRPRVLPARRRWRLGAGQRASPARQLRPLARPPGRGLAGRATSKALAPEDLEPLLALEPEVILLGSGATPGVPAGGRAGRLPEPRRRPRGDDQRRRRAHLQRAGRAKAGAWSRRSCCRAELGSRAASNRKPRPIRPKWSEAPAAVQRRARRPDSPCFRHRERTRLRVDPIDALPCGLKRAFRVTCAPVRRLRRPRVAAAYVSTKRSRSAASSRVSAVVLKSPRDHHRRVAARRVDQRHQVRDLSRTRGAAASAKSGARRTALNGVRALVRTQPAIRYASRSQSAQPPASRARASGSHCRSGAPARRIDRHEVRVVAQRVGQRLRLVRQARVLQHFLQHDASGADAAVRPRSSRGDAASPRGRATG